MSRSLRFLLIALMVAVLPLRGWAADVMSIDMASATLAQAKSGRSSASAIADRASSQTMPADCLMHTQSPDEAPNLFCSNCDTCELCLAVANLTSTAWAVGSFTRHASPAAFDASYRSAASATQLNPPIF